MSDESNQIFVEVHEGVAFALHHAEPPFASVVTIVPVSPDAGVQVGWTYDEKAGTFAEPVPAKTPVSTEYSFLGFLSLFSSDEQAAIISSDDVQIKLFCLMAAGAAFVDLTDPTTIAGVKQLEKLGLIGKGRASKVLAGTPPTAT